MCEINNFVVYTVGISHKKCHILPQITKEKKSSFHFTHISREKIFLSEWIVLFVFMGSINVRTCFRSFNDFDKQQHKVTISFIKLTWVPFISFSFDTNEYIFESLTVLKYYLYCLWVLFKATDHNFVRKFYLKNSCKNLYSK